MTTTNLESENFKDITTFALAFQRKSKSGQSAGNKRLYIKYNII